MVNVLSASIFAEHGYFSAEKFLVFAPVALASLRKNRLNEFFNFGWVLAKARTRVRAFVLESRNGK